MSATVGGTMIRDILEHEPSDGDQVWVIACGQGLHAMARVEVPAVGQDPAWKIDGLVAHMDAASGAVYVEANIRALPLPIVIKSVSMESAIEIARSKSKDAVVFFQGTTFANVRFLA